jgi:hypothetical protein
MSLSIANEIYANMFKVESCSEYIKILDYLLESDKITIRDILGSGSFGKAYVACRNNDCDLVLKVVDFGAESAFESVYINYNINNDDPRDTPLGSFFFEMTGHHPSDFWKNAIELCASAPECFPQIISAWVCNDLGFVLMEKYDITVYDIITNPIYKAKISSLQLIADCVDNITCQLDRGLYNFDTSAVNFMYRFRDHRLVMVDMDFVMKIDFHKFQKIYTKYHRRSEIFKYPAFASRLPESITYPQLLEILLHEQFERLMYSLGKPVRIVIYSELFDNPQFHQSNPKTAALLLNYFDKFKQISQ